MHLVGILFSHINDDAGQNHIKTESSISVMHLDGYIKVKVTIENNLKPIKLYSRPSSQKLCLDSSTYRNQWVSWHSSEEILTEQKNDDRKKSSDL